MSEITSFLASIWLIFEETTVPVLNISFADLWLGVFVVSLSIAILRPLLGIGAAATNVLRGVGKRASSNRRRPEPEKHQQTVRHWNI